MRKRTKDATEAERGGRKARCTERQRSAQMAGAHTLPQGWAGHETNGWAEGEKGRSTWGTRLMCQGQRRRVAGPRPPRYAQMASTLIAAKPASRAASLSGMRSWSRSSLGMTSMKATYRNVPATTWGAADPEALRRGMRKEGGLEHGRMYPRGPEAAASTASHNRGHAATQQEQPGRTRSLPPPGPQALHPVKQQPNAAPG